MVIVDTTVWIDYLGGRNTPGAIWLIDRVGKERIGLIDLILGEILQGIRDDRTCGETRERLLSFDIFASGGKEFAIEAAENFRKLRKKGITIRRTTDCWIATFCIREDHSLLHRDRDFDPFEKELGLRVVKP
jgi:predicted nucleic acid-binding protein